MNAEEFKKNPELLIAKTIKEYIVNSPKNVLDGGPMFDEPMVGFADANDPIFQEYKKIIGDFHMTPREALESRYQRLGKWSGQPQRASVIAWILPITQDTRLSLRKETIVPSLRWNHTRWHGEALNQELSKDLVALLEQLGCQAVAPMYTDFWHEVQTPQGPASNWSHRHACFAAGLGTFSLSDGFITEKGIAIRCGSAVCDVPLAPSPMKYASHVANCLYYQDKSCRRCMERCPVGAITEQGHDKNKCMDFVFVKQREILKSLGRETGYVGRYLGCGLCQTKVPCEAGIPKKKS